MVPYLTQSSARSSETLGEKELHFLADRRGFTTYFAEVRLGFSEKKIIRLFCSRHGISKLKNRKVDKIIQ